MSISISNTLIFFSILLIQFKPFQLVSCALIALLSLNLIFQRLVNGGGVFPINRKIIFLLFLWLSVIIFMIRPSTIIYFDSQYDLIWLLFGGFFIFIPSFNQTLDSVKVRKMVLDSSIIGASVSLISYFNKDSLYGLMEFAYAGTRMVGGFTGPNECASFYLITSTLAVFSYFKKEWSKMRLLILLSTSLPVIYLTYSRTALLGLAFMIIIFLAYFFYKTRRKLLYITVTTVVIYVSYQFFFQTAFSNFATIRSNAQESRNYIFEYSFQLFAEHPILGGGIGYFQSVSSIINKVPHNEFLYFLISGGMFAGLFLCWFFFTVMKYAYKSKMYPELVAVIIFITQEMSFNHLIRGRVSFLFWIVVMCVLIKKRIGETDKNNNVKNAIGVESIVGS